MFGLLIFHNVYVNLDENCRNKILGNIFNISNVSVSNVNFMENGIAFRLFNNREFYHYIFLLKNGNNKIVKNDKIIDCKIYVYSEEVISFGYFIYHLIQCHNEHQVYCLLKKYL